MKTPAWKRYLGPAAVGLGLFLLLMISQNGFAEEDPAEKWRIICDALFVPGALLASFGLLLFASKGGVFDMLRFGMQKALSVVLPKKRREALPRTFFDYKTEHEDRERKHMTSTLLVGLAFLLLAGAALVMYSQFELPG